ncbi:6-phosphogluconate dehydrogenase C-terminal domain-like protein [Coprinopsis marcescibilis]|uniref:6-phosphogluconate dehydrogenase C-terminal domain-like protein n=1 Tax=Coprinopsis marcescibilis TaxID=230819 RepID=A0A5C3LLA7_COPMA|nr:6-phosphogluconate dehydrogenase C-terminal domain-like protein [Coprinopsis marcescibilis]
MSAPGPLKDVLLVGFGAVGVIYSYILKHSGQARISVVARSNYEAVSRDGIHINSKKYGEHLGWRPDRVFRSINDAAKEGPYAYVLVATKYIPELMTTPQLLQPLLTAPYAEQHEQPTYVLLQNGLNVEKGLHQAVKAIGKGEPKIVSVAVWIGTNLVGPNSVEHGAFDRVTIGIYRYNDRTTVVNSAEEQAILDEFSGILKAGGSDVTIVPEIQRMKFVKNFWNVAFSSFATLTRHTLPAIFRSPPSQGHESYSPYVAPVSAETIEKYTLPQIEAVLEELVTLGRALGYPDSEDALSSSLPRTIIENTAEIHKKPDSSHKPSMLLDVERGQPLEVEVILGEVVRLARDVGVSVPRVEMLYALLLVVQNQILRTLQHPSHTPEQ